MSARSESSSPAADAGLRPPDAGRRPRRPDRVLGARCTCPPSTGYQIIDTPVYQEYGEAMASGQVPYRDFALEYPPGALPVFWLPTLGPAEHYRSLFEIAHVVLRGGAARPRRARRRGARRAAPPAARRCGRGRALPARARHGRADALRPLAGAAHGRRRSPPCSAGAERLGLGRARARRRREDLPARPPAARCSSTWRGAAGGGRRGSPSAPSRRRSP